LILHSYEVKKCIFCIFIFILPKRQQFTLRTEKITDETKTKIHTLQHTQTGNARQTIKQYTRKTSSLGLVLVYSVMWLN